MTEMRAYTCDHCHGEFESTWSDEEARAEAAENFPSATEAQLPMSQICDDCYKKFMGWWKGAAPEDTAKEPSGKATK